MCVCERESALQVYNPVCLAWCGGYQGYVVLTSIIIIVIVFTYSDCVLADYHRTENFRGHKIFVVFTVRLHHKK